MKHFLSDEEDGMRTIFVGQSATRSIVIHLEDYSSDALPADRRTSVVLSRRAAWFVAKQLAAIEAAWESEDDELLAAASSPAEQFDAIVLAGVEAALEEKRKRDAEIFDAAAKKKREAEIVEVVTRELETIAAFPGRDAKDEREVRDQGSAPRASGSRRIKRSEGFRGPASLLVPDDAHKGRGNREGRS